MKVSKYFILLFMVLTTISNMLFAQKADTLFIFFKQNSYSLDAAAKNKLNELAANFYRYSLVTVNGRSSEEGAAIYNLLLSKKRADEVIGYFHEKNFEGEISKNVLGEDRPAENINNLSVNRSAELILYRYPSDEEQMQKFLSDNYPPFSVYDYKSGEGLKVTSADGVYFSIPANAFVYHDGQPVSGKIEVKVSKIINMDDILQSGMNTATDHVALQTAGMFEIKAFKNKQELKLRKGSEITLNVPADSIYNDMQVFRMNDSSRIWQEAGDQFKLNTVNLKIDYGLFFKEYLTEPEKIEMARNVELMKNERRYILNLLLGALIRERMEDKINRIISLFNIQQVNMLFISSAMGTNGVALLEAKTQRALKLNDDQFKEVDFKKITAVNTTINYQPTFWTDIPEIIDMKGLTLKYYNIKLPELKIVNCDRFLNYPKLDNVAISNGQITNAKSYMIFPSLNCVLPGYMADSVNTNFNNVPKGMQAVIFTFGINKGIWYYAKKTITTGNKTEELDWIRADRELIKKEMKNI